MHNDMAGRQWKYFRKGRKCLAAVEAKVMFRSLFEMSGHVYLSTAESLMLPDFGSDVNLLFLILILLNLHTLSTVLSSK